MKSGNLNFLEPSGPLQACNGTDLPLPYLIMPANGGWDLIRRLNFNGLLTARSDTIKVLINCRFQLNAQYLISITMLLYMFRATLRPSSGGPLYIYNIWFYASLFWWPYSWKVSEGSPSLNAQYLISITMLALHVSGNLPPILRRTPVYLQHLVLCQLDAQFLY